MTVWAFLDESGDPNLEVEKGGSTHFAVGAVVVREPDIEERRTAVELVRRTHFQTGPIRSKTVGKDIGRRLRILRELAGANCRVLGLVVDKRRLDRSSGLQYRKSFMKFLNRFVYERLFRAYPALRIRADRHGRPEFMESFKDYLRRHHGQVELFAAPPEIEFVDDESEVLVQAADFIAGSLRIAYGDEVSDEEARTLLSVIRPMSLGIQEWPAAPRTQAALAETEATGELDSAVRMAAERSAYAFLAETQDAEDESSRMQVEVLQELLSALRFEESPYIRGETLAERLRERGYADCTRDRVRRSVIAPMRDRDVLIASSARGYVLASSLADVETHLARMEDEIRPILRRVHVMDTELKRVSVGRIDLLQSDRFCYLRDMLERHQQLEGRV